MRRRVLLVTLLLATPLLAWAIDVSITAIVGGPPPADTVVQFTGYAYPNGPIIIRRQGSIVGTGSANSLAQFDVSVGGQTPGIFTYTVEANDPQGNPGRSISFTINVIAEATTTISNIFLGPTINISDNTITEDDTVVVTGYTVPQSDVTIDFIASGQQQFAAGADNGGAYSRNVLGSEVGTGDHNVRSRSIEPGSLQSDYSRTLTVSVDSADPCAGFINADINCDTRVNLVDFSIMLFYWHQANPANIRADINRDGFVDLTDFSILLFNWTG